MSYVVTWGRGNRRPGSTVAEVDTALNDAAASGVPQVVGIYPPQHLAGLAGHRQGDHACGQGGWRYVSFRDIFRVCVVVGLVSV